MLGLVLGLELRLDLMLCQLNLNQRYRHAANSNMLISPKCTKQEAVLTLPCEFSHLLYSQSRKDLKIHFQVQSPMCICLPWDAFTFAYGKCWRQWRPAKETTLYVFVKLTPRNVCQTSNSVLCNFTVASVTAVGEHLGCLCCHSDGCDSDMPVSLASSVHCCCILGCIKAKDRRDAKQLESINALKHTLCWLVALKCCQDSYFNYSNVLKWLSCV